MASTAAITETNLYVYGITTAHGAHAIPLAGLQGSEVLPVVEGRLAAMVSPLRSARPRPQRSNLAAHHRVLRDMSAQRPVLPIVFGAVAGSEEALRSLLRRNHDILAERLERLEGKVEMGLKAYWEQTNIFEYFVASHQELREMRDRLFRPGRTPTIDEKLELGKCFESLLARSRQRHTRRVIEALSPVCVDIRTVDFGAERMIMKLACLVEKDKTEQWEEAVRQAAFFFDDSYRFDYSGPWPPYHFAELDLEL